MLKKQFFNRTIHDARTAMKKLCKFFNEFLGKTNRK